MVGDEHPEATKSSPSVEQPTFTFNTSELEVDRRAQWKAAIQQELQELVQKAADMRKRINEAKTQTKRDFYSKKFSRLQPKVMQMVAALQRLEMQEKMVAGEAPAPHVHDENCQHEHKEESPANESSPTEVS